QIEKITTSPSQLAAAHPRSGFQHPQREEPVRLRSLQKHTELSDGPHLAALPGQARWMGVADHVPLSPAPGHEVLPCPVQHAVRVNHRLRVQARRHGNFLWLCRPLPLGLDRLADIGIVGRVLPVAPHAVIAVWTAGEHAAIGGEPADVGRGIGSASFLWLCPYPALRVEPGIQPVTDLSPDVLPWAVDRLTRARTHYPA